MVRKLGGSRSCIVISPFVSHLHPFRGAKDPGDRLAVLKELIEAGKITPVIDRTFPLSEARRQSATWRRDTLEARSSITV